MTDLDALERVIEAAPDITTAMRRAFSMGQTYWQQADSESYSQNAKSDITQAKFTQLVAETRDSYVCAVNALPALIAEVRALRADAIRYRWLRACQWTQELSQWSKHRTWLWSTRFAACASAGGDLDPVTQGQELDAAIDERIAGDAALSTQQAPHV